MSAPVSDNPLASDGLEVEWQFDAPDLEAVDRWLRAQPPHAAFTFAPQEERLQADTYLDTDDWQVYRAGYTLRVRRAKRVEATLKAFATASDGPRRRREINEPLAEASTSPLEGEGPVSDRLRALLGRHELRTLFEVETRRRPYLVQSGGTTLATIALDEAHVNGDTSAINTIRRVEVEESVPGALTRIESFINALCAACGLTPGTTSKFEAGLRAAGLSPQASFDLGPTALDHDATADHYAFAVLRRHFGVFLAHEPGTRLDEDIEELHEMRVATRRMRAAMSTFADVLPSAIPPLREELRWVAGVLGEVRDLDVQLEALEETQRNAGWNEGTALGPLVEIVRTTRSEAYARMLLALDSDRYDTLVRDLTATLRAGPPSGLDAPPVRTYAAPVLKRRYRRLKRDADMLTPASDAAEYHELRVRGKRFRYSLEFFSELYGRPAARVTSATKALQDLLGEHQDSEVAIGWLHAVTREHGHRLPPETLLAMGELLERHRQRMRERRQQFPATFKRLRNEWRSLRRSLDRREDGTRDHISDRPSPNGARTSQRNPFLLFRGLYRRD